MSTLPEDPRLLKEIIQALLQDNQRLEQQVEVLQRTMFGRKSERVVSEQLLMPFAETPAPPPPPAPEPPVAPVSPPAAKKRNGHGRTPVSADLKRVRIEHDVPVEKRVCKECQAVLTKITEQLVERLEWVPGSFIVQQLVKAVYACAKCHGCMMVAEVPSGPIEKGLAGPGLMAHVIVSKYADHLPLERQSGIFAREGVPLAPSTLGEWVAAGAELLSPIRDEIEKDVLRSRKLHFDETLLRVMEPGRGVTRRTSTGTFVGDDDHPGVAYRFSPTEAKAYVYETLDAYAGFLHADAAPGYDRLYKSGKIIEVACWAHTRRKFINASSSDPVNARAAVAWIRRLYDVEALARGKPPNEIKGIRQEMARPILIEFEAWLKMSRLMLNETQISPSLGLTPLLLPGCER